VIPGVVDKVLGDEKIPGPSELFDDAQFIREPLFQFRRDRQISFLETY